MSIGLLLLISALNFGPVSPMPGIASPGTPAAAVAAALSETGALPCGPADAAAAVSPQASPKPDKPGQKKDTPKAEESKEEEKKMAPRIETWGEMDPGAGFLVGRTKWGELGISGYGMVRYINQLPAEQTYVDHLGNEHPVDTRNDIFPQRAMFWFKGWMGTTKLVYNILIWTVNSTYQQGIFPTIGYQFSRKFSLYAGIDGLPGTRSIMGSHPFWLAPDRVMADEFFRSFFTYAVYAQGEITPGLWYKVTVGNNNSALGIKATDLDRKLSYGGSLWWMPTTHEFGPRGGYGDFERHDKVATRFGAGYVYSPENRQTSSPTGASNNTTIRLADSLNVFDTDSLAPGVTVQSVDYHVLSADAAFKYRGYFLHIEVYNRDLTNFLADGPLPVTRVDDWGFHIQAAFFPIPRKLELYVVTSQIYGDKDAGFGHPTEYLAGFNYFIAKSRNFRFNAQVMDVNRSPVSSTFGYYVGGQKGTTVSTAVSVFF